MSSYLGRSRLLIGLLGATLALAVLLAVQAQMAVRSHRATAEGVLQDYAAFAAEEFRNRGGQRISQTGYVLLTALGNAGASDPGRPLPDTAGLVLSDAGRAALPHVQATFRLEPGGRVDIRPTPSPQEADWLEDLVAREAREVYEKDWYLASLLPEGPAGDVVVLYTVRFREDGTPRLAWGVVASPALLRDLFQAVERRDPLLPRTLTGGDAVDSAASIRVTAPGGRQVYVSGHGGSTGPYDPSLTASADFGPVYGGLAVDLTLRPDIAPRLVIGGLPRSRLPVVLGALVVSALLILTAAMQLHRERALARRQADFVASVSHELRTPLAQIRMFAETLRLGRVRSDAEQERSLMIVDSEARRLSHLVDNLLHVARSERGEHGLRLRPEEVQVGPALREVVEGFEPLAQSRRAMMRSELEEGLATVVDRSALRQMVLNLLDNAVKYGPSGGRITLGAVLAEGCIRIRVEDEGPGVPPEERERVWDRFARLDRDRESSVAGSGIGLAIVRELVEAHGGRAWVEAGASGGARFVLELPAGRRRTGADVGTTERKAG